VSTLYIFLVLVQLCDEIFPTSAQNRAMKIALTSNNSIIVDSVPASYIFGSVAFVEYLTVKQTKKESKTCVSSLPTPALITDQLLTASRSRLTKPASFLRHWTSANKIDSVIYKKS